ncbi:putative F-box/LRR-repeat protein At3g59170 [Solanum verrucosum]|uniref:putative F-box/LRR-repeat protein At3g59170 n=1 Tax=Solanum verrucosum TaxID=315347 RepID=UPI0020D1359B|nr:putative F-box/LRR-repeat protein At3g59170 [Solanum verrucosum]
MTSMDVLSECVIHKKLSYLSFQESAKLSLVSKTWLQAWLTHPNLEFTLLSSKHGNNIHDRKIVDQVMERYRQTKIPIEKFQLSVTILSLHRPFVFPQMDKWLGIALQNGVKDLSCEVSLPSYPFPIFTFLAPKSLRELVLLGCNLILDHSLSITTTQVISCHSLRKLSLTEVGLDDNMLRALLNCCPLIDDFIIEHCRLLTKIELRNLQNIKSVSISCCKNQSVTIQTPTLQHLSYFGCFLEDSPVLDIVECRNLKSLQLIDMRISEGFLQCLISTSQFLERLTLDYVSTRLERFKICGSPSVKFLAIENCKGLQEIDAPNLVSLEYDEDQIPELKVAKRCRQLKKSQLCLDSLKILNAEWFGELRKFLSKSSSWSLVSLNFEECSEINLKDLVLHHTVATPKVNDLVVRIESSDKCPTLLVDALLWSCHPKKNQVLK